MKSLLKKSLTALVLLAVVLDAAPAQGKAEQGPVKETVISLATADNTYGISTDPELQDSVSQLIKEKTGYTINPIISPLASYSDKVTTLVNSGDAPDIFIVAQAMVKIPQMAARGQLLDLTGYIKNSKALSVIDPELFKTPYVDGKIYFVPYNYPKSKGIYIRKDIMPLIIALLINELKSFRAKKTIQFLIYIPYFFSWVVVGSIFVNLLSPTSGPVNAFLGLFGVEPIYFMAKGKTEADGGKAKDNELVSGGYFVSPSGTVSADLRYFRKAFKGDPERYQYLKSQLHGQNDDPDEENTWAKAVKWTIEGRDLTLIRRYDALRAEFKAKKTESNRIPDALEIKDVMCPVIASNVCCTSYRYGE